MDLQSLRTFVAVTEAGGILAASRSLDTVQSNVTARIQRLERELDTDLFYRKGRGLTLAPSGRVLLGYARQILELESRAGQAVRQVGGQSGELRIGAMETFAALRLPAVLSQLREAHPSLSIRVQTETSQVLTRQLIDHEIDCALVGGPVDHPDLVATEVAVEELVLVLARNDESDSAPLILFREGCAYRARALAWQRSLGHQVDEVMEFGTLDGILGCVAAGLGRTLMPRRVVDHSHFQQQLKVQTIDPALAKVPTVLIRHRQALPMPALDTLRDAIQAHRLAA